MGIYIHAGCLVACRCSQGKGSLVGLAVLAQRVGGVFQPMRMDERRTRPTQTRGGARKANDNPATTVWVLPDRGLMEVAPLSGLAESSLSRTFLHS